MTEKQIKISQNAKKQLQDFLRKRAHEESYRPFLPNIMSIKPERPIIALPKQSTERLIMVEEEESQPPKKRKNESNTMESKMKSVVDTPKMEPVTILDPVMVDHKNEQQKTEEKVLKEMDTLITKEIDEMCVKIQLEAACQRRRHNIQVKNKNLQKLIREKLSNLK